MEIGDLLTIREELQRMYQEAALVHADEIPVPGTTLADIDQEYFAVPVGWISASASTNSKDMAPEPVATTNANKL